MTTDDDTAPTTGNRKLREHGLVSYTTATIEAADGWGTIFSGGMPTNVPATGCVLIVEGTHEAFGTRKLSDVRKTIARGSAATLAKFAKAHKITLTSTV